VPAVRASQTLPEPLAAASLLALALAALRISEWSGPVGAVFVRNAAVLTSSWMIWSLVVAGLAAVLSTRAPSRLRTPIHGAMLLAGLLLPELTLRVHDVGAATGDSRERQALVWSAGFFGAVLLLWLLLRRDGRGALSLQWVRWRSLASVGAVIVIALVASSLASPSSSPRRFRGDPNILLVVIDALRADALGCYGNPLVPSPNIDALAARGWRFENAFSTATTSVPGHASVLWGLEVSEHRALSNEFDLPADLPPSLAEVLHTKGYRNFGVCQNPLVSASSGFAAGFDHYWSWFEHDLGRAPIQEAGLAFAPLRLVVELMGLEPIRMRTQWQLGADSPWFGFVQYLYTHDPYYDGDDWATPARVARVDSLIASGAISNDTSHSRQEVAEFHASYYGALAYVDRQLGALLEGMSEDERDNTVVIVTSDHGENLTEHGDEAVGRHFGSYQTSLRVPLIVADLRRDDPRVVESLTGIDRIRDILLALIDESPATALGAATKIRHVAYSHPLLVALDDSTKIVIDGSDLTRLPQVFRWRDDPLDRTRLGIDSVVGAEVVVDSLYALQLRLAPILQGSSAKLRPEKLQRLRALGYLQ
jgi:Sulfatase